MGGHRRVRSTGTLKHGAPQGEKLGKEMETGFVRKIPIEIRLVEEKIGRRKKRDMNETIRQRSGRYSHLYSYVNACLRCCIFKKNT